MGRSSLSTSRTPLFLGLHGIDSCVPRDGAHNQCGCGSARPHLYALAAINQTGSNCARPVEGGSR